MGGAGRKVSGEGGPVGRQRAALALDGCLELLVERLLLRTGTLLGGYYSFGEMTRGPRGEVYFSKMQLWPERAVEFLGFLLDLDNRTIAVPEGKMEYILRRLRGWLAQAELASLGFHTRFDVVDIDTKDPEIWRGVKRRYWWGDKYFLPTCTLTGGQ